jgi:hypothetical protein
MTLEPGVTIIDEKKFVQSHMSFIDNNPQEDKSRFREPYERRIRLFMDIKAISDTNELRKLYDVPPVMASKNK